jgi:hypothetical protein
MIEQVASAIVGAALFLLFALLGRWIVQDTRRAFCNFWPDDPHYPHKPWKVAVFKGLGYFALFVSVMNATAVLLLGLMPRTFRENGVVSIVVLAVSITLAVVVVKRSAPRLA